MIGVLRHRGPDGEGAVYLPDCALGQARLSIIDIEGGAQPMADWTGRYHITLNGEIYNYRELKQDLLERGHRFRTQSDTEVILAAYAEWGPACLDRLRGMFSFALWDRETGRLFAARDLFGEKPFYYAVGSKGWLVFGSEIKALVASQLVHPTLSRPAVEAFLALGYVPPSRTIYENVEVLPPAHYLVWDGRTFRTVQYWRPRLQTRAIAFDEAAAQLRTLVHQAVRRQMVADVPVGAFLSGGHDSSTVVAVMQAESAAPVKTFSVGFGDAESELPYARSVAARYRTEHHEIDAGAPPVGELLHVLASQQDEPQGDPSAIPTYLVSQYASRHVKVVLTGDGGDEMFGGYAWYPMLARSEERPASTARWLLLRAAAALPTAGSAALIRRARAMRIALRWPEMVTRYFEYVLDPRGDYRYRVWGDPGGAVPRFRLGPADPAWPADGEQGMNRAFYFDLTSWLPGDILVKVDRTAMAHGLETRPPFLDRDLAEFVFSLPVQLKVTPNATKILYRHAFSDYWPDKVQAREKRGFAPPFREWMTRPDVQGLLREVRSDNSKLRDLLPGLEDVWSDLDEKRRWFLL
ncbi:MAG TPA: asparagine synthase (glutamine-hydrolyzing), partial [bacterium]